MTSCTVTYEALCATAAALGIDIGVGLRDGRHEIVLVDYGRCRSLTVPVADSFDAAVTVLCCSLALVRDCPGCVGEGVRLAAMWPELAALGSTLPTA